MTSGAERDEELTHDDDGVGLLNEATTHRLHERAHTAATRKATRIHTRGPAESGHTIMSERASARSPELEHAVPPEGTRIIRSYHK